MPFYLSEYVGTGTAADPFVAVDGGQVGSSTIDLRPDCSRLDGGGLNACLVWTPAAFSDARARFLADDALQSLTNPQKNFITNRLGVDLTSESLLGDIIGAIMTRPPAGRWKPLVATRSSMRAEVWMAGQLVWSKAATLGPQGQLVDPSDNFNRANETPIAAPWTNLMGSNANLSGSAMVGTGDALYGYTGSVATADHYSQVVCPNMTTQEAGPACRCRNTGGGEAYLVVLGGFHNFYKLVGGSYTSIVTTGDLESDGATARLEVEGSTLRYYQAGALSSNSPQTDTSITAIGLAGVRFAAASTLDDWTGADLGLPPQKVVPDADVTTTGWTTTPLFSKINETAADGTVITATAS